MKCVKILVCMMLIFLYSTYANADDIVFNCYQVEFYAESGAVEGQIYCNVTIVINESEVKINNYSLNRYNTVTVKRILTRHDKFGDEVYEILMNGGIVQIYMKDQFMLFYDEFGKKNAGYKYR